MAKLELAKLTGTTKDAHPYVMCEFGEWGESTPTETKVVEGRCGWTQQQLNMSFDVSRWVIGVEIGNHMYPTLPYPVLMSYQYHTTPPPPLLLCYPLFSSYHQYVFYLPCSYRCINNMILYLITPCNLLSNH